MKGKGWQSAFCIGIARAIFGNKVAHCLSAGDVFEQLNSASAGLAVAHAHKQVKNHLLHPFLFLRNSRLFSSSHLPRSASMALYTSITITTSSVSLGDIFLGIFRRMQYEFAVDQSDANFDTALMKIVSFRLVLVKSQSVKSQKSCTIRESVDNRYNNKLLYFLSVFVRLTFDKLIGRISTICLRI